MKEKFIVKGLGGKKILSGKIKINGAKNAILPTMAASILFKDGFELNNIPNIEDVKRMSELLGCLGSEVSKKSENKYLINSKGLNKFDLDRKISEQMRASIILTGPLLARFGQVLKIKN